MLPKTLQGIVASEPVRKVHRSLPYVPSECVISSSADTLHNSRIDPSIALKKAKNNAFTGCSASSFPFPPAAEVGLVDLNFTFQLARFQAQQHGKSLRGYAGILG